MIRPEIVQSVLEAIQAGCIYYTLWKCIPQFGNPVSEGVLTDVQSIGSLLEKF
jgi:hypothetical protein